MPAPPASYLQQSQQFTTAGAPGTGMPVPPAATTAADSGEVIWHRDAGAHSHASAHSKLSRPSFHAG
ncbi:hypothetical protein GBF38_019989, partial [Nibea albiflora]